MPCEGCHVQFTVFKRKHVCYDCKRYYCHNCLANSSNYNNKYTLCERCLLFTKRPLKRSDLINLKSKDLIFYLQSKHISTSGCVEKEELIDLVLQYVNRAERDKQKFANGSASGSSSGSTSQQNSPQLNTGSGVSTGVGHEEQQQKRSADYEKGGSNSFDSLKQTCQNFFSNLSDNISDSFANLESKACSKNRPTNSMTATASGNVTEQPRIATRAIPTYASSQQNSPENPLSNAIGPQPASSDDYNKEILVVNLPPDRKEHENYDDADGHEECNCSDDDEFLASFNGRTRSPKSELQSPNDARTENNLNIEINSTLNSTTTSALPNSASNSKPPSLYSKLEIYVNDDEESSHSSFEELGAIGGISDDSKTTTDTTSNTTEHWQILDLKTSETETFSTANAQQDAQQQPILDSSHELVHDLLYNAPKTNIESIVESKESTQPPPTAHITSRAKKVTRRRSESYLNRRQHQASVDDDENDLNAVMQRRIDEQIQTFLASEIKKSSAKRSCTRCGKNKANIRQQVEKMRKHLEGSQMSEIEIKQELAEFLKYLEQRTKSVEYSDSDAGISSASANRNANEIEDEEEETTLQNESESMSNENATVGNINDRIRVSHLYDKDSRFINLGDIECSKQLECLTVKQLKEILMLHRVDYKGCCEKQELLDRVQRLWKNLKSTPAVEKLPTDELCKICMDAPIECVILECGHMATCTNCGKVLSECPICRQYIVRIVRFFRA